MIQALDKVIIKKQYNNNNNNHKMKIREISKIKINKKNQELKIAGKDKVKNLKSQLLTSIIIKTEIIITTTIIKSK